MDPTSPHRVFRQVIDLTVDSHAEAGRLYVELSGILGNTIAPVLDEVFERICPEGVTLRIQRAEVDLGLLPRDDLPVALKSRLKERLWALLDRDSQNSATPGKLENVERLSESQMRAERLLQFLQTGAVTARQGHCSHDELASDLELLLDRDPADLAWVVNDAPYPVLERRLLAQFDRTICLRVARLLKDQRNRDELVRQLESVGGDSCGEARSDPSLDMDSSDSMPMAQVAAGYSVKLPSTPPIEARTGNEGWQQGSALSVDRAALPDEPDENVRGHDLQRDGAVAAVESSPLSLSLWGDPLGTRERQPPVELLADGSRENASGRAQEHVTSHLDLPVLRTTVAVDERQPVSSPPAESVGRADPVAARFEAQSSSRAERRGSPGIGPHVVAAMLGASDNEVQDPDLVSGQSVVVHSEKAKQACSTQGALHHDAVCSDVSGATASVRPAESGAFEQAIARAPDANAVRAEPSSEDIMGLPSRNVPQRSSIVDQAIPKAMHQPGGAKTTQAQCSGESEKDATTQSSPRRAEISDVRSESEVTSAPSAWHVLPGSNAAAEVGDLASTQFVRSQSAESLSEPASWQLDHLGLPTRGGTEIRETARASDQFWPRDERTSLLVTQSGLVILWPFLSRLFESVGVVQQRRFVSDRARQVAVGLLAHLADGEDHWGEQQLVLAKILCSYPLFEPIDTQWHFSDNERQECVQLLSSTLSHWPGLQNTSIGGFQQSFLTRHGALTDSENGWSLKVSRVGYDVLLERLPWGIGVVVLPWMERPVYVDW